jgi:hypothetical protein
MSITPLNSNLRISEGGRVSVNSEYHDYGGGGLVTLGGDIGTAYRVQVRGNNSRVTFTNSSSRTEKRVRSTTFNYDNSH